jgi:two-component system, response regulator FlrC
MPSKSVDYSSERQSVNSSASFELSGDGRACIRHLIGHRLALIERELILQTLRHNYGNRTRSAEWLGISLRSLRDRIRSYRRYGHDVPTPIEPSRRHVQ